MLKIPNPSNKNTFRVIGVMSGTSLDGLDICLCKFVNDAKRWSYEIESACTIPYTGEIKENLSSIHNASGIDLTKFDYEYGKWIGRQIKEFLRNIDPKLDFIASHGHTIFHKPNEGYTLQIGKGSAIAAESGLPCICDFRSSDVCRNGQGAPLVPIGDRHLFSNYDICLNLGGFANLSYESDKSRLAFDIAPCNIILNKLAQLTGLEYDKDGELGKTGNINNDMLEELNSLDYYRKLSPKSLGREWIDDILYPIIEKYNIPSTDKLRTLYEHISTQISLATNSIKGKNILVTGGGAHNSFLILLLKNKSNHSIVIPDNLTIDYKEALIFAFLGVLYIAQDYGALTSVTGASADSISGCMYY